MQLQCALNVDNLGPVCDASQAIFGDAKGLIAHAIPRGLKGRVTLHYLHAMGHVSLRKQPDSKECT